MLTIYGPPKSSDSEDSGKDTIIPAGRTYLTKVNGKLMFARQKTPKATDIAMDLLGDVFGLRPSVRRQSKSLDKPKTVSLLVAGPTGYTQPQLPYSAPIVQQPFQSFSPYQQLPTGHPHLCTSCQRPQQSIPYQQSQSYLSSITPMQPVQAVQEPQRYTVPPSKPTVEDFESLREIDAHYNEMNGKNGKKAKPLSAGPHIEEEVIAKTTITITKHICANCGRLRSRKYHAENPIKAGETPTPAFCRKCQKDSSETSGSDRGKSPKKKKDEEEKPGNKEKKDRWSSKSFIEDERTNSPDTTEQKSKSKKNEGAKRVPSEEYIIVEEEISEDDRPATTRNRQYLRIEESDVGRRRSRSSYQDSRYTKQENVREPASDSPFYQTKPARGRGGRSTISRSEEDLYKYAPPSESLNIPVRTMDREESFDTFTSQRSTESRRRRRVERAKPDTGSAARWNQPHVLHPQPGDETIIVTERYVYKPKRNLEEQRRQQEYVDRASYANENDSASLNEEASRYYHNDWFENEDTHSREESLRRGRRPGRYRRGSIDSELAESESTDFRTARDAVFHDIPHRVPSIPSPEPTTTKPWSEISYLGEEYAQPATAEKRGEGRRKDSPKQHRRRGSSADPNSSRYYSHFTPYQNKGPATNARFSSPQRSPRPGPEYDDVYYNENRQDRSDTEKALVPSPRKHRQRAPSYEDIDDDDDDSSNLTERERIVERDAKKVTFKDPTPSPAFISAAHSERSGASFLKKKTSWDDSAVNGGGDGGSKW